MRQLLSLLVTVLLAGLLGCPADKSPAPPEVAPAPSTNEPAAKKADFERVDAGFAFGTAPLRARVGLPSKRTAAERLSVGDFYARLHGAFGPPTSVDRLGFTWVFRHKPTGLVVTAYARGAGPGYGGGYRTEAGAPPPKPEDALELVARAGREPPGFLEVARGLDAVLEAAPLVDCEIVYTVQGTTLRSGARGGVAFDEALPAGDALLHALEAFEAQPPSDALFDERGDRVLDIWTERAAAREAHADKRARVAAYWSRAVARLAKEPVTEDNDQVRALRWAQLWRTRGVNEDAALLATLESLKPDPWPAALDALKP